MRSIGWTCIVFFFILLAPASLLRGESAEELYKRGRAAERDGDVVRAYLLYAQAAVLDPEKPDYWARSQALRTRAAIEAKAMPGDLADSPETLEEDPDDELSTLTAADFAEARTLRPPPELQPRDGRNSFDIADGARRLFEEVGRAFGLEVVFDGEYQDGARIRLRLEDVTYLEALRALEAATGSFVVPVSDRMILVAKDTPQKRQEVESTVAVVIPIPHTVSVQEAQELARSVQQAMEIQKFGVDTQRRLVLIRDRVSKVRAAQEIFEQTLRHRAQILIEVELLEVARNSSLEYGLRLQKSFPVVWLSKIFNSVPAFPAGFTNFAVFGAGKTFLGLGLADGELFAAMSRSASRSLMKSEIRSVDSQPAQFHVGDRFPIMTAGFFGAVDQPGDVFTPPPTFQFEDLGLVLKITPHVHGVSEVTLELEAEFKVLTGQVSNGIPVISNRKFQSVVRVRQGEWAVVAGLMRAQEARNISGIAGLAQLPLLGPLFRENTRTEEMGETLLILRPKLVNLPPSEFPAPRFWVGTESRPLSPM